MPGVGRKVKEKKDESGAGGSVSSSCCHWWWSCCCCHCSGSFYLDNVVRYAPILHTIFKSPGNTHLLLLLI